MDILIYFIFNTIDVTGQHDRQDEKLTGQLPNQSGHHPLTCRYFEPCDDRDVIERCAGSSSKKLSKTYNRVV